MKPLVSTITPCFRMKKYLKLFLEELPKQTFFNQLEIVLDHNEPDDEEVEWVKEFQRKYPNRLKHIIINSVEPIGPSMNRCIKEAGADVVAIWNVDDLRTVDSIEKQYNVLSDDVGISYGNYQVVTSFGDKNGEFVYHDNIDSKEFTRGMIFGPFMMFKKDLCNKVGYFDEQLRSGADFDLAIRLALHSKAGFVRESLGYYLNEGLGASTRPNSKQPLERTLIELRYGIYDKIDYHYLSELNKYDIFSIYYFGDKYSVNKFVHEYDRFLKERSNLWLNKGIVKYCFKFILRKIKFLLKRIILKNNK